MTSSWRNQEKEQAKKDLSAKQEGKSASPSNKTGQRVFNGRNVMPRADRYRTSHTELLVPTDGIYELVPTVVGPRYSSEKESSKTAGFVNTPYLHQGQTNQLPSHLSEVQPGCRLKLTYLRGYFGIRTKCRSINSP
jgi:hypothetical protein